MPRLALQLTIAISLICLVLTAGAVIAGALTPRGSWLAWVSEKVLDSEISVWDGRVVVNFSVKAPWYSVFPTWSTDGRLAWVAGYDIVVWDGEQVRNLSQTPESGDYSPAWSADGRLAWVAASGDDSEIMVWDGEQVRNVSQNPDLRDTMPEWSQDGRLAWRSSRRPEQDFSLVVWDGQQIILVGRNPDAQNLLFTWSADGQLAWEFLRSGQSDLFVWGGARTVCVSPNRGWHDYTWSDDGRLAWASVQDRGDGSFYGTVSRSATSAGSWTRRVATRGGAATGSWHGPRQLARARKL
ncbi:MAG: PD40 domain-containing protein [Chloroflexi bacterium]|nr:PD40 domain-containing protein [Chloroflexota bacterium]